MPLCLLPPLKDIKFIIFIYFIHLFTLGSVYVISRTYIGMRLCMPNSMISVHVSLSVKPERVPGAPDTH